MADEKVAGLKRISIVHILDKEDLEFLDQLLDEHCDPTFSTRGDKIRALGNKLEALEDFHENVVEALDLDEKVVAGYERAVAGIEKLKEAAEEWGRWRDRLDAGDFRRVDLNMALEHVDPQALARVL